MKKAIIGVSAAICMVLIGVIVSVRLHIAPSTGIYLSAANEKHLIVVNKTPILISGKNETCFANLQTGDKVLVFITSTNDSFPAEAGAYACFKLGTGDLSAVPEPVLQELEQLGWISPQG